MRGPHVLLLMLLVVACAVPAGCVQSSAGAPSLPAITAPPATATPALPETTIAPRETVTIIRYVSPPRDVRDSALLFALRVPAAWNISTWRLSRSDTSDYRTDAGGCPAFSITTFPITPAREQEYREQLRLDLKAPLETTVTINGIRYDRFEERAGGNTTVAYLVHSTSANERGYGSVLVYTARDGYPFEREDFEEVVSSFRYFGIRSAASITGEEIPHHDAWRNAESPAANTAMSDTSDWDSAGPDYSAPESDESSSPSGGGGHCNR